MTARVARTEVCDDESCTVAHQLVRGDQISFVSVEQARDVGCKTGACPMALDDNKMPSDIELPPQYVLVHDANGVIYDPCHFFVVRWKNSGARDIHPDDVKVATEYFGTNSLVYGSVEVPNSPWKRIAKVRFIRYRRHGHPRGFEHEYKPPVWLYSTGRSPLAWKIVLPHGCIVDARGFVKP